MLEIYETSDDYNLEQLERFCIWIDSNIGVEYEVNDGYIVIFDLNNRELSLVMKFESYFRLMDGMSDYNDKA